MFIIFNTVCCAIFLLIIAEIENVHF